MANEKALKVAELKSGETGRGVTRIDPEVMEILGLKVGDIVQIDDALIEVENLPLAKKSHQFGKIVIRQGQMLCQFVELVLRDLLSGLGIFRQESFFYFVKSLKFQAFVDEFLDSSRCLGRFGRLLFLGGKWRVLFRHLVCFLDRFCFPGRLFRLAYFCVLLSL